MPDMVVNKTEDRGQFGLFGGVIKSATHEDQIIVITLPEFEKAGEPTRIMGRSRVTCFPLEQDPLTVFFKFAGTVPNYLKTMTAPLVQLLGPLVQLLRPTRCAQRAGPLHSVGRDVQAVDRTDVIVSSLEDRIPRSLYAPLLKTRVTTPKSSPPLLVPVA
jgi:hypothetical protein